MKLSFSLTRVVSILIPLVMVPVSSNVFAAASSCDIAAAHPDDTQKVSNGIAWDDINLPAALSACEQDLARQSGNARLQFQYARVLDKQKSYEQAFEYYLMAAKQGHVLAQNALGIAYEWGLGVVANNQKALYWYSKAADQGYAQAQNNLGTMYDIGKGNGEDVKKALYWFQQAAAQGDATAQRNLGLMYSRGSGVMQNDKTAFEWYLKAANQNYASAQYYVGISYYYGKGVSSDPARAVEWFRKAAVNGNYEATQVIQQIEFKQSYCDTLKSKVGIDAGYEKLASQKFLGTRECGG